MIIHGADALRTYAATLAKTHKKILLTGELGAGKTTFAGGFASGLGIDPMMVTSPTYTYQQAYAIPGSETSLLHLDLYRMKTVEHAMRLGIFELIDEHEYVLIERPKWEEEYVDAKEGWIHVTLEKIDDEGRVVTLSAVV